MTRPSTSQCLRILLLSHYYAPELGAPQTRLRETVRELKVLGHDVRVVTGPPHYPDGVVRAGYRAGRIQRETIDGTDVLRLPMIPRRNGGFLDRSIDQMSFAATAMSAVGPARWADVVVVESPPLFLGATAAFLKGVARRPYLFHVADPWPDIPVATGALRNPFAIRIGRALESLAYRHAALITTPTAGLVALLERNPTARGRVRLLPNGVDVQRFQPDADRIAARTVLGWPIELFTVVYVGSVGLAQGVRTLIDAAAMLEDVPVVIHVIGEGFERDRLAAEASSRGIVGIRFQPAVPAARVPTLLAAADASVTVLRADPVYAHALPTKLVEGLAAGRPVLVSAPDGVGKVIGEAGLAVPAEDPAALAAAVLQLRTADPAQVAAMGAAGRHLAEDVYDRRVVARRLSEYLLELSMDGQRGIVGPS